MSNPGQIYLPDGEQIFLPRIPITWADAGAAVQGTPLRARTLTRDAGGAAALHRQRPLFQGIATLAQTFTTAVWAPVTGLAELIDNYGGHSDSANTSRFYAPWLNSSAGGGDDWWLLTGLIPFNSSDAAHSFTAGFRISGGTIYEGGKLPSGSGHGVTCMTIDLLPMSVGSGDYVELMGRQVTGGDVTTVVTGKSPVLTARWVCMNPSWTYAATPALPATPRTWLPTDYPTGSLTGVAPDGGQYVPLNTELRDRAHFLNNPPIVRVTSQGTTQTIPSGSGTWTSLTWTSETVDNYGGWNAGAPTRYVCQRAGLYFVAGCAAVAEPGTNTGYRATRLLINGSAAFAGWSSVPQTSGTTGTSLYAVAHLRLAVGDYVELQMQQTQGSALSVNSAAGNASKLIAVWMAK